MIVYRVELLNSQKHTKRFEWFSNKQKAQANYNKCYRKYRKKETEYYPSEIKKFEIKRRKKDVINILNNYFEEHINGWPSIKLLYEDTI